MPRDIPLLILDEVVLPTSETEVGLSDPERHALMQALGPDGGLAGIVARPPGAPAPTSLERKAAPDSPGAIMRACIFGTARVAAPDANDDTFRLQVTDILRGHLQDVMPASSDAIWRAHVETAPLLGEFPEEVTLAGLRDRFLRLLLATRDLDANPAAMRQQLGRPLRELRAVDGDVRQLWLLADYLFEQPSVRVALMQANELEFLAHTVADALELAETGMPLNPKALARPLVRTIATASEDATTSLGDLGHIVAALAPLVVAGDGADKLTSEAQRISEAAATLANDVDRFVTRLAKAATRKQR